MTEATTPAIPVNPAKPRLIIAFQGLMHFQSGKNRSRHVAILDARDYICPHEDAKIYIWRDGKIDGDPIPLCKDDVVSLDVAPGRLRRDSLYRRHVPKLRDFILLGDVDPKIVQRLSADGALAYFMLPPGRLTTWSTYRNPAELFKNTGRRKTKCFARFVVLETTITTDVELTVYRAKLSTLASPPIEATKITRWLTPYDVVFVSNIRPGSASDYHPHFPAYAKFLSYGGQVSPVRLSDVTCDQQQGKGQFREAVEQALELNSNPAPNGDCGPTGP